ncbi:HAMP domain-containing protein [Neiella sp. HB171785]|uniref:HAMP domain-containing protein n=1 Tax=Neiella litorisoli TaxID=2771431 RepID=A0A8J6QK02_9GAMM|nr:methyl-accepting chemotaxis protein [Neiella litorisoli]MBD1390638.1 HAMP domain-containing protein [Neiella litorisoli]
MKLSVAMRVILGFTVITALLLFSGASSLLSLSTVNNSQKQVNDVAIPTLNAVNNLQLKIAASHTITLEAFYADKTAGVDQMMPQFDDRLAQLDAALSTLMAIDFDNSEFQQNRQQAQTITTEFISSARQSIEARRASLMARQQALSSFEDLTDNADDASGYLLDLLDSAEGSEIASVQQVASFANNLDVKVMSTLTVNQDILTMTKTEQLNTAKSELDFIVREIQSLTDSIVERQDELDEPEYVDDVTDSIDAVLSLLSSNQSPLLKQRTAIEQQHIAKQMHDQFEGQSTRLSSLLLGLADSVSDFSQQAQTAVTDEVSSGKRVNTIVMIISVLLAAAIAFVVVRSIVLPLNRVNGMLKTLASGDLTQRLETSQNDEFGVLATNVNVLIDNLREVINGIVDRSAQLGSAAEQTSAITEQTTVSIQQQRSEIEQVATATTEMNSTAQQVVNSANDTLAAIKHADDEAEHVKQLAYNNRQTMESLAEEVDNASNVINQLHEDSTSISSILDVIRGIAEQTNLLALNAAIEAARAGEQGRGFAVVADEVRSLASRTQESTQEINEMIEKLQEGAERAVKSMEQGKQKATQCVQQTEESTNALQVITDSVHHAHDISSQINTAAQEQTSVTAQISERLEQIVTIAEENASGAQQTSQASHQVSDLSTQLKRSIEQFTV